MRKTKTKFRWLAFLLAMVSLFGVLAIPASADYYYAMKVSVYYKDESGKTLAPTFTTTVNATTTTLSVPSPTISSEKRQRCLRSVQQNGKALSGIQLCAGGKRQLYRVLCQGKHGLYFLCVF